MVKSASRSRSYLSQCQVVADSGHGVSWGGGGGIGGGGEREWGVAVRGGCSVEMDPGGNGGERGENKNSYNVTHRCIDIP